MSTQRENAELEANAAFAYCKAKWPQIKWWIDTDPDSPVWAVGNMPMGGTKSLRTGSLSIEVFSDRQGLCSCEARFHAFQIQGGLTLTKCDPTRTDMIHLRVYRDTWQEAIAALEAKLTTLSAFIPVNGGEA